MRHHYKMIFPSNVWRAMIIALLGLIGISTAHAAPPSSYEVEVLIFEQRIPELERGELWALTDKPGEPVDAIPIGTTPTTSDFSTVVAALARDPRYRMLSHTRWSQGGDSREAARPVAIAGTSTELSGGVRLYVSRYLHVELNLGFQPAGGNGLHYRINQQRRVNTKEWHYFDHPKFGALVRVVPSAR